MDNNKQEDFFGTFKEWKDKINLIYSNVRFDNNGTHAFAIVLGGIDVGMYSHIRQGGWIINK